MLTDQESPTTTAYRYGNYNSCLVYLTDADRAMSKGPNLRSGEKERSQSLSGPTGPKASDASTRIADMTVADLQSLIRDEINAAMQETVGDRLEKIEEGMQQMAEMLNTVAALESGLQFNSTSVDDIYNSTLPAFTGC